MFKIVTKKQLNPTVTLMDIEAPFVAKKAQPGQFIILRTDENGERIPLTIAGYDREKGKDDIIYIAINTYWEEVEITLPKLQNGAWRLSVDTYGDKKGRYFYEEGNEPRMGNAYRMKPRTVAVFTKRDF